MNPRNCLKELKSSKYQEAIFRRAHSPSPCACPPGTEAFHLHLRAGVRQLAFYNTVFHISRKQRARNALGVGQERKGDSAESRARVTR